MVVAEAKCWACAEEFTSRKKLFDHFKTYEDHEIDPPHSCTQCGCVLDGDADNTDIHYIIECNCGKWDSSFSIAYKIIGIVVFSIGVNYLT